MTYTHFRYAHQWGDLWQKLEKTGEMYGSIGFEELSRIYASMWAFYYYEFDDEEDTFDIPE